VPNATIEIQTIHEQLLALISEYGQNIAKQPIAYESHAYPYFFKDENKNGSADADEAIYPNRYQSWTPRLLKAAYNYQFVAKDPGAYAHNPDYVMQILIDSISDLNVALDRSEAKYKRP